MAYLKAAPLTIILLIFDASLSFAGEFNVFGPISYQRGTGAPVTEITTFAVKDPTAPYVIRIHNGGLTDGEFEKVSSSVFILNGVQIVGPSEFNQNISIIQKPVTLSSTNTLSVEVRGKPGGGLTVQIIGNDIVPPLVSITQPSDGLKTKETLITVTGRASDVTTSVSSVTVNGSPATLTGEAFEAKMTLVEGPNTITALATDLVGNQAQVSILSPETQPRLMYLSQVLQISLHSTPIVSLYLEL